MTERDCFRMRRSLPALGKWRCRIPVGEFDSLTTTTTAGKICSSRRAMTSTLLNWLRPICITVSRWAWFEIQEQVSSTCRRNRDPFFSSRGSRVASQSEISTTTDASTRWSLQTTAGFVSCTMKLQRQITGWLWNSSDTEATATRSAPK